jgi:short-subunit dehydrogenase
MVRPEAIPGAVSANPQVNYGLAHLFGLEKRASCYFISIKKNCMEKNNQYALVTGASSGIGYELARLLAADGYHLILVSRTQEDLDRVAAELKGAHGVDVRVIAKDLFYPGNAMELTDEVHDLGVSVDILVNDAGQGQYGPFVAGDLDRQLDIIHLNIESLVVLTHYFLKDMVSRGQGRILNLASIAGKTPGPLQAVYHGTKAFVHSFSEAIRSEVKEAGVTVTSLLPGATDTDFFNKADMLEAKNVKEGELAEASKVAKDGYEALMSGKDMVVSGLKNKMTVAMSNVLSDEKVADQVKKQQSPAEQPAH